MLLKCFYAGRNFSVYHVKGVRRLMPLLESGDKGSVKVRSWKPGDEGVPNRIDRKGNFYVKEGEELKGVDYVVSVDEQEWVEIPPILTPHNVAFCVEHIQPVFSLKHGAFFVKRTDVYEPLDPTCPVNFYCESESPVFLRKLDRMGLRPKKLSIHKVIPKSCGGYVEGGIPSNLSLKVRSIYKTYFFSGENPIKNSFYPSVPLYRDVDDTNCWFAERLEDWNWLVWTGPCQFTFLPEEVERLFGIKTNQPFQISLDCQPSFRYEPESDYIPTYAIREVVSQRPVLVSYRNDYKVCWRKEGKPVVEGIKLNKVYSLDANSLFVGCLEDLPKLIDDWFIYLVELPENLSLEAALEDSKSWYRLYYLDSGELKALPGRYVNLANLTKYGLSELGSIRRRSLEGLKHLLPGSVFAWTQEQQFEYNRLLESGEYSTKPTIRIGDYAYEPKSDSLTKKASLEVRRFDAIEKAFLYPQPRFVKLYRVVDLNELIKKEERLRDLPYFSETLSVLCQKGFTYNYAYQILDAVFGAGGWLYSDSTNRGSDERSFETLVGVLAKAKIPTHVISAAFELYAPSSSSKQPPYEPPRPKIRVGQYFYRPHTFWLQKVVEELVLQHPVCSDAYVELDKVLERLVEGNCEVGSNVEHEVFEGMYALWKRGFSRDYLCQILEGVLNPSNGVVWIFPGFGTVEIEEALTSWLSLGVPVEVIAQAFAAHMDLPWTSRLLVFDYYSNQD